MLDRILVFENPNDAELEIRECSPYAPPGHYATRISLKPFGQREFRAAKFYNRNLDLGHPTVILFFINGVESSRKLTPQHFLRYVKMVAYVDLETRGLTIKGIEPHWTDLCRLRGFKFLGRNYQGRQEMTALFKKGVSEVDTERAIKLVVENREASEDHDLGIAMSKLSFDQLYIQASKQWLRSNGVPRETRKSRIVRWLQYRGFNWNIIKTAITEKIEQHWTKKKNEGSVAFL